MMPTILNYIRGILKTLQVILQGQLYDRRLLTKILHRLQSDRQSVHFDYNVTIQDKPRKERSMIEVNLTNEQKVVVKVTPKTSKGKDVKLDGPITATSDNPDTVVNIIDDNTFEIISPDDVVGDRTIIVSGDADPGSGVVTIEDTVIIHVGNPMAVSLGLAASTPEDK